MADIITNLHPDGDKNTNLYPNIKKENIPRKSISTDKLDDNVLSLIGSLKPSGTDTSTNILSYTSNKGIYVATDNGHWYYWNGNAYADGGVYQGTVPQDNVCFKFYGSVATDTDLNTLINEGQYNLIAGRTYSNLPVSTINGYGILLVYRVYSNILIQEWICRYNVGTQVKEQHYIRHLYGEKWYDWEDCNIISSSKLKDNDCFKNYGNVPTGIDLNVLTNLGMYILLSDRTYTNTATSINSYAILINYHVNSVIVIQEWISQTPTSQQHYQRLLYGTTWSEWEDLINSKNTIHQISVKADGTGDYTKVQDAINSITNSTKDKQYIINIYEGTYNLASDFTSDDLSNSEFAGIFVPDFVTLRGCGDKTKIILKAELEEKNQHISTINLKNTSSLENLTIIGNKTRYAIHDDFASQNENGYERILKDVIVKGINNYYGVPYGAGMKQGANFKYINCVFDGTESSMGSNGLTYIIHNNVNFNLPCSIEFTNCRFISNKTNSVQFKTISTNANNMFTYISLYGNKFGTGENGFALLEENADIYGKGCLFNVTGYGNVNDTYIINTTDGVDYSSNVNLI